MAFPANDLERILAAASARGVPASAFVQALVEATVWVPMRPDGAGGQRPAGVEIEGRVCIPVFTSPEQAERGAPGLPLAQIAVRDIVANSPSSGVAVNLGGEVGLPIWAEGLRTALDGGQPVTLPAGTTLRIGLPAVEPMELLGAIARHLEPVEAARSARRCWVQMGDAEPGLVVGVVLDPADDATRHEVLRTVAAAGAEQHHAFTVDVVFADGGGDPWTWMAQHVEPFWSRD